MRSKRQVAGTTSPPQTFAAMASMAGNRRIVALRKVCNFFIGILVCESLVEFRNVAWVSRGRLGLMSHLLLPFSAAEIQGSVSILNTGHFLPVLKDCDGIEIFAPRLSLEPLCQSR